MNEKIKAAPRAVSPMSDYAETAQSTPEVRTRLEFRESKNVSFEVDSTGNLLVTVKGYELPPFEGSTLNQDYVEFLREHKVSGMVIDAIYDGIADSMLRGLAMEALMSTLLK